MSEEYNDNMHKLIVERLEERNRKLQIMDDLEKPAKKVRFIPWIGVAVAACLIGVVFFATEEIFLGTGEEETFRGGDANVETLIKDGKYEDALKVIDKEIAESDSAIYNIKGTREELDEESQYELQAEEQKRESLIKKKAEIEKKLK